MLHCPTCGKEYSADLKFCPQDASPLYADPTNLSTPTGDPLLGRTLDDKYLLEDKLGIGGMGTVYRARHLLIDRIVAVKVLNPRLVEDEAARARFRREAKAAGRLRHTNAVGVTDFGETSDGCVYIVMELLEGKTLQSLLARNGPLDVAHAVSIMLQVSSAVAAAHDAGIIHRDLKPANIFIVQRSDIPTVVKVLDFGIAKLAAESFDEEDHQTLTQIGAMIGTPRYMSPEQCEGEALTPAADVYSLGVILYEMLTGTVPFNGLTPLAIAMRHSTETPRRPSEFVPIPSELEGVVLHALEKPPEKRPRDSGAFREELLETAERLGLEHAEASTAPSLEALRSAGTESPSGRLVVDLGRLRENRAATSGAGEYPSISMSDPSTITKLHSGELATRGRHDVRRLDIPIHNGDGSRWSKPKLVAVTVLVALIALIAGLALMFNRADRPPEATVVATPSPTAKASPSPSPALSRSRSPAPSPSPTAQKDDAQEGDLAKKQDKKPSKIGSALNKVKKVFTKPF